MNPRPAANLGRIFGVALLLIAGLAARNEASAASLFAGVAKADITHKDSLPANGTLYVKALALRYETNTAVIITVDAVAIGEIGHIGNRYLPNVRAQLLKELNLAPEHVLINASHCHGIVSGDVEARTVQAVKAAFANMVPVKTGAGSGYEDRIMENRRLKLKNGREADVRHAYSLPPDEEVAAVGPVDTEIGLLRLDRLDGRPLALVYNFACHPILGCHGDGNTADLVGFASRTIEDQLGEGALALFIQGCGGDINPVLYKDTNQPRHAEPLGLMLGLSALKAHKKIVTQAGSPLKLIHQTLALPRAELTPFIAALQTEQARLLQTLTGTSLNLKTFMPLAVKYSLAADFPSYYSHRYLHEKMMGRDGLAKLDAENRTNMVKYIRNIHTMEELTRVQTNLNLLKMHHAQNVAAGKPTLDAEVLGLRIGEFKLITFPGELTVQIGLNIKKAAPQKNTFVAGYSNGYIYYCPTAEQLKNRGGAQEDSDCLLAPEWQKLFEDKAAELLKKL
ncbi:MAG: hypothetical protein EXS24_01730 [Pedosphaera sp.]|nr:hypothetical protein [Pedosphaera sp.]